jgi:hypothetical protein
MSLFFYFSVYHVTRKQINKPDFYFIAEKVKRTPNSRAYNFLSDVIEEIVLIFNTFFSRLLNTLNIAIMKAKKSVYGYLL